MASTARPRPTLRSLAHSLDLSVATVSRALSDDPRIAEATRARVHAEAQAVGYRRDHTARLLKSGKTYLISAVVDFPPDMHIGNQIFVHDLIRGLEQTLGPTPYQLNMVPNFDVDGLEVYRRTVEERMADGLVFSPTRRDDPRIHYLQSQGFPFASLGRGHQPKPASFVDFDNAGFAEQAVAHLASQGVDRLLILAPSEAFAYSWDLLEGARKGAQVASLDLETYPDRTAEDGAFDALRRHLPGLVPAGHHTGVISSGGYAAHEFVRACEMAGLRLGHDFDVVAKTGPHFVDLMPRGLTVFIEDHVAEGAALAKVLLAQFEAPSEPCTNILFHPTAPKTLV